MKRDPLLAFKYPIGPYNPPEIITPQHIAAWINQIETLPQRLSEVANQLTDQQLDTPYRPGGWTARQVIHHVPDSHLNSYIRFKWALTEDNPTIKAYEENKWAVLMDTYNQPIDLPLEFLAVIHKKLVKLFNSLTSEQLKRTFIHPETGNQIPLDWNIGQYAWHGEHHLGHVKLVLYN